VTNSIDVEYEAILKKSENKTERAREILELAERFEFGHFDQTRALWHYNASARLGNTDALFTMGTLHSTAGLGALRDPVIALANYHVAAVNRHKGAQRALGYRYLYGIGVPKNCTLAVTYYELVANTVMRERERSLVPPTSPDIDKIYDASSYTSTSHTDRQTNHLVEYYTSLSESGNPEARLRMGYLHLQGANSASQDFDRAFEYFTEASESAKKSATKVNARLALAHIHFQGLGSRESNATRAYELWNEILKLDNNGDAHNGLGVLYLLGATKQTPKDLLKARSLFTKASERGSMNGFYNLGMSYLLGTGNDDRSFAKAAQFISLAVQRGSLDAMYKLAQMKLRGVDGSGIVAVDLYSFSSSSTRASTNRYSSKSSTKKCESVTSLFKTVAESDPNGGLSLMREAHEHYIADDIVSAISLYTRAAEQGYVEAQMNAAWLLQKISAETSDLEKRFQAQNEARVLFSRAASQGNVMAKLRLGDWYYYDLGGLSVTSSDSNFKHSVSYYRSASLNQNSQALFNMGFMYQFGLGVPVDLHLSKRFYDQSYEVNPKAKAPAKLALLSLSLQRTYLRWSDWFEEKQTWLFEIFSSWVSET